MNFKEYSEEFIIKKSHNLKITNLYRYLRLQIFQSVCIDEKKIFNPLTVSKKSLKSSFVP
jgi:hypothetical protein